MSRIFSLPEQGGSDLINGIVKMKAAEWPAKGGQAGVPSLAFPGVDFSDGGDTPPCLRQAGISPPP